MSQSPAQSVVARRALGISLATLASRILGFGRDLLMAWLLGGSLAADALVIALRLPQATRRLFAEGALSLALTADLEHSRHASPGSPPLGDAATTPDILARAVQWRLGLVLLLTVLAAEILTMPLIRLLAPGAAGNAPLLDLAAQLATVTLPYMMCAGMAALAMARLHLAGNFTLPALMPLAFNLCVISASGWALWLRQARRITTAEAALLIACGVLAGGLVQWLAQEFTLKRTSRPPAPGGGHAMGRHTGQAATRLVARMPLGALGAAAPQLALLAAMAAASWLAQGSVAALYYAEKLMELPMGLAAAALGMASLPTLARQAGHGQLEDFCRTTHGTLRWALCVTLPAAAGLAALAAPLVHALFARGAFDAAAATATATALVGYCLGIPAHGLTRPLLTAAHALGLARQAACSGLVAVGVTMALSLFLMALFRHVPNAPTPLLGPALGVSLGLWAQGLYIWRVLRRALQARGGGLPPLRLLPFVLGAALAALAAHAVSLAPWGGEWKALCAAVCAGIAVYAAVLALCSCPEWRMLCHALRMWLRRQSRR